MRLVVALALIAACGSSSEKQEPQADRPAPDARASAIAPPVLPFEVPPPSDKILGLGRTRVYTCVVRASGAVDCWGQLGVGRPEPKPRRIPGVADAIAINNNASCVLRKTGQVACFARDRIELLTIPKLEDVVALGTGSGFCFVHRDGGVSCTDHGYDSATRVAGMTDLVAVSSGNQYCGTKRDGQVVCTGWKAPAPAPLKGLGPVRAFSFVNAGVSNGACAILETGALRCFAVARDDDDVLAATNVDAYGQAVEGWDAQLITAPAAISLAEEPDFSTGHSFELEVISGGKVVRWDRDGTRVIPDLTDAVQLAYGCALRAQGSVVCWGSNAGGGAGQPTTIGRMRRPPKTVVGAANVAALALGGSDSWARTIDHHVLHWGSHAEGWATEVPVPAGVGAIRSVAASTYGSACLLADGGAVWCWTPHAPAFARRVERGVLSIAAADRWLFALNSDMSITTHELDRPFSERHRSEPEVLPPALPDTTAIYAGGYRRCVMMKQGEVACESKGWTRAPRVTGATDIAPGYKSCALRAGSLTCWTYDLDTTTVRSAEPPKANDITAIASGGHQLCAVRARGRVTCYHGAGFDPLDVLASGAVDVEVGALGLEEHRNLDRDGGPYACAVMADRSVTCWGTNVGGALGDGSVRHSARPLGVQGLD
ncbi:MAG: hypothetical protein H0T46_19360 [Deltaproteobacteria bacterium]|nr:hypothetical protein [Deltaproteobacteria bacterium]